MQLSQIYWDNKGEYALQNTFKDMCRCIHFIDGWEADDERLATVYSGTKEEHGEDTARHRCKFTVLEATYNKRWQAIVKFGRWVTAYESRVAGWHHFAMPAVPSLSPLRREQLYTLVYNSRAIENLQAFRVRIWQCQ